MKPHANRAEIIPEYQFHVGCLAPATEFSSAEAVQTSLATWLHIPEEHNLRVAEVPPQEDQPADTHRYLGNVAFMEFEGLAPTTWKAEIMVVVEEPGRLTRALARLTFTKAKAGVRATGNGRRPFGGDGDMPRRAPLLPVGPQGDLLHV